MYVDHVVVLLHHGHVLPYGFYLGQKVGFRARLAPVLGPRIGPSGVRDEDGFIFA
ncbi:unnamed protein product [Prunus brigantina]